MFKILVKLSGSIAAYKCCYLISRLVQSGHEVRVVATRSALEFVGRASLEGLSGHAVFSDIYESGRMMDHIHLSKWADIAVVYPASANTIARLSQGLSDDPVGALFLAWDLKKPYLVAPAMNQQMFQHPATREALKKLESFGVQMLWGGPGHQACGDIGLGRLMEPDAVFEVIQNKKGKLL